MLSGDFSMPGTTLLKLGDEYGEVWWAMVIRDASYPARPDVEVACRGSPTAPDMAPFQRLAGIQFFLF